MLLFAGVVALLPLGGCGASADFGTAMAAPARRDVRLCALL